jgi:hypothetical protein
MDSTPGDGQSHFRPPGRQGVGTLAIDRNPRLSCGDGQTSTHPPPDGRETLWARGWVGRWQSWRVSRPSDLRKGTGGGRFCGETAQNRATQQAAGDVAGVPGAARLDAGGGCPNSVSGRPRVPGGCVSRPGARRQSRGGVVAAVSRSAVFIQNFPKNGQKRSATAPPGGESRAVPPPGSAGRAADGDRSKFRDQPAPGRCSTA